MKSKSLLLLFFFLLVAWKTNAETQKLSPSSYVVLYTCGPGQELYAGFGHSALWISDEKNEIDRLYNYGTFDFNTPHFYWKFTRGRLDYMLSVTTVNRFLTEYKYRGIKVTAQRLDLSLEERQKLFDLIEENCKPENCFYRYDFFYDNCATRLRDIVVAATDGNAKFHQEDEHLSFREMLHPYLKHSPWTKFGIDMILGLSSDKIATPNEYMYLPEKMRLAFEKATIQHAETVTPLVRVERNVMEQQFVLESSWLLHPVTVFGLMLLAVMYIGYFEVKRGKTLQGLDPVLFGISIFVGLFLLFMWLGTDHSATNQNLNVLWLLPAQLLFVIAGCLKAKSKLVLQKTSCALLLVILLSMIFWPQGSELAFGLFGLIFFARMCVHVIMETKLCAR